MVSFYQHKTNKDHYIFSYTNDIDIKTVNLIDKFASSHFQKGNIQLISILDKNTHITEMKAVLLLAETNKQNENNIIYSDTVGLFGIQKLLYKIFIKASNSKVTQRVYDSIQEIEEFHNIQIFTDFEEIKSLKNTNNYVSL